MQWRIRENRKASRASVIWFKEYMAKPCRLEGEECFFYYHLAVTGGGDTPESPDAVAGSYLAMLDEKMEKIIHTIMDAKYHLMKVRF